MTNLLSVVVVNVTPELWVAAKKILSPVFKSAAVVTVIEVGPLTVAFRLSEANNDIIPVVASTL